MLVVFAPWPTNANSTESVWLVVTAGSTLVVVDDVLDPEVGVPSSGLAVSTPDST